MVKKTIIIVWLVGWLFMELAGMGVVTPRLEAAESTPDDAPQLSCTRPRAEQAAACAELVQQILDSTVRIQMHSWTGAAGQSALTPGRVSHATIKDGRYLVTHNHFQHPLQATAQSDYVAISLYRVDGDPILQHAPLSAFTVVAEDATTLVLEFSDGSGRGLFESLGLPSARFAHWQKLDLAPGMEVAQVLWNGRNTSVQWTSIDNVIVEGTPRLELHSTLGTGSSGGGVFWQGYHIGNNLSRTRVRGPQQEIIRLYSTVALNDMPAETAVCLYLGLCQTNPWADDTISATLIRRGWRPI
jgi:hypothetical protein